MILYTITMMNTMANAQICLLNDFIKSAFALISSVVPLSADAIKKLEDSRDGWQRLRSQHFSDLLLMTKLVALGVILEGPEIVYEIIQLLRRWRKKSTREHGPGLITVIGLIGWALVSVGVAGEFWVDSWVNTDDDNIQSINITLLRDAYSSASAAAAAAQSAQDLARGASDIAVPAKASAATALTLARGATAEALSAENDLGKVRADVARVEEKYAPRTLSKTERDALVAILKSAPIHPDSPIEVESFIGAPDGVSFGEEIVAAINDSQTGWRAQYGAENSMGGSLKGLVLLIHDPASVPPWAIFLQRSLQVAGFGAGAVTYDGQQKGTVTIFIAPKN